MARGARWAVALTLVAAVAALDVLDVPRPGAREDRFLLRQPRQHKGGSKSAGGHLDVPVVSGGTTTISVEPPAPSLTIPVPDPGIVDDTGLPLIEVTGVEPHPSMPNSGEPEAPVVPPRITVGGTDVDPSSGGFAISVEPPMIPRIEVDTPRLQKKEQEFSFREHAHRSVLGGAVSTAKKWEAPRGSAEWPANGIKVEIVRPWVSSFSADGVWTPLPLCSRKLDEDMTIGELLEELPETCRSADSDRIGLDVPISALRMCGVSTTRARVSVDDCSTGHAAQLDSATSISAVAEGAAGTVQLCGMYQWEERLLRTFVESEGRVSPMNRFAVSEHTSPEVRRAGYCLMCRIMRVQNSIRAVYTHAPLEWVARQLVSPNDPHYDGLATALVLLQESLLMAQENDVKEREKNLEPVRRCWGHPLDSSGCGFMEECTYEGPFRPPSCRVPSVELNANIMDTVNDIFINTIMTTSAKTRQPMTIRRIPARRGLAMSTVWDAAFQLLDRANEELLDPELTGLHPESTTAEYSVFKRAEEEGYTCKAFKIFDQGHCGSCWTQAASSTYSQSLCLSTRGVADTVVARMGFSARKLGVPLGLNDANLRTRQVSQLVTESHGGKVEDALESILERPDNTPIVADVCRPYECRDWSAEEIAQAEEDAKALAADEFLEMGEEKMGFHVGLGQRHREACRDPARTMRYAAQKIVELEVSVQGYTTIPSVYKHVREHGPMAVSQRGHYYSSYKDMDGVFAPREMFPATKHAVTLVGWGVRPGREGRPQPYWLFANSYGETFGEGGLFRMVRGMERECLSNARKLWTQMAENAGVGEDYRRAWEALKDCEMDAFFAHILAQHSSIIGVIPAATTIKSYESMVSDCKAAGSVTTCEAGGELARSAGGTGCECLCPKGWTGPRCEQCDIPDGGCKDFEEWDNESCSCKCPEGTWGERCGSRVEVSFRAERTDDDQEWRVTVRVETVRTQLPRPDQLGHGVDWGLFPRLYLGDDDKTFAGADLLGKAFIAVATSDKPRLEHASVPIDPVEGAEAVALVRAAGSDEPQWGLSIVLANGYNDDRTLLLTSLVPVTARREE